MVTARPPRPSGTPHLAPHAEKRHDDFDTHAVPHTGRHPGQKEKSGAIAGGYESPATNPGAPHAEERHDDFDTHAVPHTGRHPGQREKSGAIAGGYETPHDNPGAPHASERHEDFASLFVPHPDPKIGGFVSVGHKPRKDDHG